jgi:hypothetical protein
MTIDTSSEAEEPESPLDDRVVSAIDLVVGAFGELDAWFATSVGGIEGRPEALHRLARRAGAPAVAERIPRDGDLARLDFDDSVELARALARRHGAEVEAHLQAEEQISAGWSAPEGLGSATSVHQLVRSWVAGAA